MASVEETVEPISPLVFFFSFLSLLLYILAFFSFCFYHGIVLEQMVFFFYPTPSFFPTLSFFLFLKGVKLNFFFFCI